MSNATPEEIVTTFIDLINRKDLIAATNLLSEDCEYDNVPMGKTFGLMAGLKCLALGFLRSRTKK